MPKKVFFYNKAIDKQIVRAAGEVLARPVKKAVKMPHGEVNHVYKIVTDKGNFLARVFKSGDWPENGMLQWIEKQLTKHKISHAKILYYSRGSKFFPHGFMITEFIEGLNGEAAVDEGKLTFAQAYNNIGKVLRRVHKIKAKRFGGIRRGKGQYKTLLEYKLKGDLIRNFEKLNKAGQMPKNLFLKSEEAVKGLLAPFESRFVPVLNHGDPNRQNAIWSNNSQWILIDWDNAFFSTWLEDYADLTFWADFKPKDSYTGKMLKIFKKHFFKGYGKVGFSRKEIIKIERALHIVKCFRLFYYFYFVKDNKKDFRLARKKLLSLLK